MATSFTTVHLDATASTQDDARRLFGDEPVLVTAASQSAGRGRSGAKWVDADRSLAASLAFRPGWPPDLWSLISLVAGLAALDALGDVRLKWPNDVVYGKDKVAGILSESDGEVAVVGIGVNLWWSKPIAGAAGLWNEDRGAEVARSLASAWAGRLLDRLGADPNDWGCDEYQSHCVTIGEEIAWEPTGTGRAVGIDDRGRLQVETTDGLISLDSGAVRQVRETRIRSQEPRTES
jgi:BirA family transcriptional regulator, biotin operon repressor / biotin---[acetyl-CoA-carboxylase] ligase